MVPTKDTVYNLPIGDRIVYSDFYYADFDDDWHCEVWVGRASVQNTSEVATFINKLLTYEKNPPSNYSTKAFLFAFDLAADCKGERCKEDSIVPYFPSVFNPNTKVYDSHSGNHKTNSINALNAGHNLVNHIDHANIDCIGTGSINHDWMISNWKMDVLTNGNKQSILYSTGCHTTEFPVEDCIAEHFVHNPNGGGVVWIGNSGTGFFEHGNPYQLGHRYDIAFFKCLLGIGYYRVGLTLSMAKNLFQPQSDWHRDYDRYTLEALTLIGDPEMSIWTDSVMTLNVVHDSEFWDCRDDTFKVEVHHGAEPVQNAQVCVWKEGDFYLVKQTNSSGLAIFILPDNAPTGSMYVTVTAHNYKPYEGTCLYHSGSAWPPPTVEVKSPNGGEHWRVGSSHNILWEVDDCYRQILYYSTDAGENWITIDTLDGTPRSYPWTIPNTPSSNCRVKLEATNLGGTSYDVSDSDFGIYSDSTITFIRADANSDLDVGLPDAVYLLRYKFVPGSPSPSCMKAADADDNGSVGMPDALHILKYKFVPGSPPPPPPFPYCGGDPTPDGLGCEAHPCMGLAQAKGGQKSGGRLILGKPEIDGCRAIVPVYLTNTVALAGFAYTIEYDPSCLVASSVENRGLATQDFDFFSAKPEKGKIAVGNLVSLTLKKSLLPGEYHVADIEFEFTSVDVDKTELKLVDVELVDTEANLLSCKGEGCTIDCWLWLRIPKVFSLSQAFPNPFTGGTTIRYSLPRESRVLLNIHNISGQLVKALVDELQKPGYYSVEWNGNDETDTKVPAGVYFVRLEAGDYRNTKKLILLR